MRGEAPSALVAGIDGGGSRTRLLLTDERGEEVAYLEGPPVVGSYGHLSDAAERIAELVRSAAEEAGFEALLPVATLAAGLAGAGREEDRLSVEESVRRTAVARRVRVVTDVEAAYHDAFAAGPGVLLAAGTGSILLARNGGGEILRVGGWGPVLGDEGSGYWVAVEALRAVMRAHDGRAEATLLERDILEATGATAATDLPAWTRTASRARIAELAPRVLHRAEAGDAVAARIRVRALGALREHLAVAARWMRHAGEPSPELRVALTGGLIGPQGPLRAATEEAAAELDVTLRADRVRPERGAARIALELRNEGGGGARGR